jgi:hypothetical protein
MRQLQDAPAPQARRLLRLLFLRFGKMSTNAGRELHQLRNWVSLGCGGSSGKAEIAELLFRAPGRRVRLVHLLQEAKSLAEFSGNG